MPNPARRQPAANSYYNDVLWCCVPLLALSCYYYGLRPLLLMAVALITSYLCDCVSVPLHAPGYQPGVPSSACFAALIVLLMPPSVPYVIIVVAVAAAVLVKEGFGGDGHYPFHPTAVGVVVAGVSWPQYVFRYPAPGTTLPLWGSEMPALTAGMNAALRDGGLPTASTTNLLIGNVQGPLGASAILVVAACGLFLLCRGHLKPATVLPFLAVCVGVPWLFPQLNELPVFSWPWQYIRQRIYLEKYILLSGAILFGAVFLAGEPVTQPNRTVSRIVYGVALGLATVAFRYYSEYETSVCFALLIVGAIPEWLDRVGRRAERMRFMKKEEKRRALRIRKA